MRQCRRMVSTIVYAVGAMVAQSGHAALEYVTRVGSCTKVDQIGDGKDLVIQAGKNVRFEVWGGGVDYVGDIAHANALMPKVVSHRDGPTNLAGPCHQGTGSLLVEADTQGSAPASVQTTLHFLPPFGADPWPLQIKILAYRQPVWTWLVSTSTVGPGGGIVQTLGALQQTPAECLTKNLTTPIVDNQSHRLTITLPPGASTDSSNCTLRFNTRLVPQDEPELDVGRSWSYALAGVPAFMQTVQGSTSPDSTIQAVQPKFDVDVAGLRSITIPRTFTLTATTPNDKSDSLTLVVNPPPLTNAFTQAVACTPSMVDVNDFVSCELRLAQIPPAGGQPITFEALDRLCFAPATAAVTYNGATGVGTFTAPHSGTIHQLPLRALGGQTSAGTPCASATGVAHLLRFWVGPRDSPKGPDFGEAQVRIRQRP